MIPFMKLKWFALALSVGMITFVFYHTFAIEKGFAKSIDFAGGIVLTIHSNEQVTLEKVKNLLDKEKISAIVQKTGKEKLHLFKVDIGLQDEIILEKKAASMKKELEENGFSANSVDYLRFLMAQRLSDGDAYKIVFESASHVGPTIGEYLKKSAIKVLSIALILIVIYVAFRFRINFAMGALVALLHDLAMTMGMIGIFQVPLSVPVIAALLTILGYSINDTIVIFDRIRENMKKTEDIDMEDTFNLSINESFSRTIVTSVTTLIAVSSVYVFGGEGLEEMSFVLILGIIIGTYSSSFVASPVVLFWDKIFQRKH